MGKKLIDMSSQRDANVSFVRDSRAGGLLRRLPGGGLVEARLTQAEERVMSSLKQRLDAAGRTPSVSLVAVAVAGRQDSRLPAQLLDELLRMSVDQTREQAEMAFFGQLLRQVTPDEARILAGLADDAAYPIIEVVAGSRFGASYPLVAYVTSVGKKVGIKCQELCSDYVRHLVALGLVEVRPLCLSDNTQYQILESDSRVRAACDGSRGGGRARIVKQSLHMSDTGKRLWALCRSADDGVI